ncbi:hypothetical protein DENSPDRAFT_887147 [Dentipellis sp. KUC8613]|nr:hypothetical protein DENSPDRAFT_887147 [Dentipellis sp. KUC8613]
MTSRAPCRRATVTRLRMPQSPACAPPFRARWPLARHHTTPTLPHCRSTAISRPHAAVMHMNGAISRHSRALILPARAPVTPSCMPPAPRHTSCPTVTPQHRRRASSAFARRCPPSLCPHAAALPSRRCHPPWRAVTRAVTCPPSPFSHSHRAPLRCRRTPSHRPPSLPSRTATSALPLCTARPPAPQHLPSRYCHPPPHPITRSHARSLAAIALPPRAIAPSSCAVAPPHLPPLTLVPPSRGPCRRRAPCGHRGHCAPVTRPCFTCTESSV